MDIIKPQCNNALLLNKCSIPESCLFVLFDALDALTPNYNRTRLRGHCLEKCAKLLSLAPTKILLLLIVLMQLLRDNNVMPVYMLRGPNSDKECFNYFSV